MNNSVATGEDITGEGLVDATWKGGVAGAVSGGVSSGLASLGAAYGGSWENPATWFGNAPVLNEAVSSSVSSMVMAGIEGEDIGEAGLMGLAYGAGSSMLSSAATLGYIGLGGKVDYGDGSMIMREDEAVAYMRNHPGAVSGSFANDLTSFIIAIFSGGGPLSHVRGSDFDDEVIENNSGTGAISYDAVDGKGNPLYKKDPNRLTLVTNKYASGVNQNTPLVSSFGNNNGYWRTGLCTGATHTINPAFKGGAPNALLPLQYRHSFMVNPW